MTRYLFFLALLPGCGLVRAVDQGARDAGQDAALAETNVSVATAHHGIAANTTAILDLRDRLADTPEEHAEIARLRGENEARIAEIGAKLRSAEAVAAEKARQAQNAEAAVLEADENAWWRITLEIALTVLGVGGAGAAALRWRGLFGNAIKALTEIGEVGIDAFFKGRVQIEGTSTRDWLTEKYREINNAYGIDSWVRKTLGKPSKKEQK